MLERAEEVFNRLEDLEQAPASIYHSNSALHDSLLPPAKKNKKHASKSKTKPETTLPEATWTESTMTAYASNTHSLLEAVAMQLGAEGVTPVLLDKNSGKADSALLVIPVTARAKVNSILRKLRNSYNIRFQ